MGVGLIPTVSAHQSIRSNKSKDTTWQHTNPSRKDFKVSGTKRTKTIFKPETIVTEATYRSKDLKRRYGMTPPVTTEEPVVIDRSQIPSGEDTYPTNDVVVHKEPWESHFARKEEWESLIKGRRKGTHQEVGIQDDHPPEDQGNCGRAVWNYKQTDDGYDESAPVNLVVRGVGMEDMEEILEHENGWDNLENTIIPREGDRYAWDMDRDAWVGPDNEPYGEYGGWGTKSAGIDGRHHVRCYELEPGIVSIQAHEDGWWDPWKRAHDVVSYQSTRDLLIDIFTSADSFFHQVGTVDSGPEGWGDDGADDNHDGIAVILRGYLKEIDRNC